MSEELDKEISLMNDALSGDLSVEEPEQEPKAEEPEVQEEPTKEPESEVAEEPEPEPEPEKEDKSTEVIRALQDQISALTSKLDGLINKQTEPEPEPELEDVQFATEDDLQALDSDLGNLNSILNKVYKQVHAKVSASIGEGVLKSIPQIVNANIGAYITMTKQAEDFYSANPDLKPFKKVVATVFEELSSKNPGKKYEDYMKDLADTVRKRLNLVKKASVTKPPQVRGASGRNVPKPKVDKLEADIAAMNQLLNR